VLAARAELRQSEAEVTIATVAVLKALGAGISHESAGEIAQVQTPPHTASQ
jgi:hypothetical protein